MNVGVVLVADILGDGSWDWSLVMLVGSMVPVPISGSLLVAFELWGRVAVEQETHGLLELFSLYYIFTSRPTIILWKTFR